MTADIRQMEVLMTIQENRKIVQQLATNGTTPGYMPGFGNDYETEALPGALPQGMNSPRNASMVFMQSIVRNSIYCTEPSE